MEKFKQKHKLGINILFTGNEEKRIKKQKTNQVCLHQ
jgi:hypothetical protein